MNILLYILAMALTTYLIRVLPLTIFRKPIRSRYLRSVLYYVPYTCLTAMTFPAILGSTGFNGIIGDRCPGCGRVPGLSGKESDCGGAEQQCGSAPHRGGAEAGRTSLIGKPGFFFLLL